MRISDWSSDVCSSDLLQLRWIRGRPKPALITRSNCAITQIGQHSIEPDRRMKIMRTDTTTFAKYVFRAVRDLGINSVRPTQVARRISSAFSYGFHNPYGHCSFDARKNIETNDIQRPEERAEGKECVRPC